ncbi:MAG: extracellular solute-binding protein [Alphaproteobacteria bacterium]
MAHQKIELTEFKALLAKGALTRRQIHRALAAVGVATVSVPLTRRAVLAAPAIEVFTWTVYAVPELQGSYIAAYGEAPPQTIYGDNDEAFQKVRAGYLPTIIQPTSSLVPRWREADLLSPIDTTKLANYPDVFPKLKDLKVMSHEGVVYGVPLAWGNSSVLYRKDLAPEYVGNDTWTMLWDPKYAGRLAQFDQIDDVVMEASLLLGIEDPFHLTDDDLERVRAKLAEQRPLLRFYWSDQTTAIQALAAGEIVATYAWNDAYAQMKKEGYDVGYMIPKEGILTWVDATCIIKGGPGSDEEAHAYVDAVIAPEAGKFFIEEYGYGSSNAKAYEIANLDLLKELGIDDHERMLELGLFYDAFAPGLRDKAITMFEEVKAGY